jgi:xylose isomerase
MCQENPAESLTILDSHGKLGQIHLNENYRDADPDMIFGTVNFWENLEFFYYLNKTSFAGWATIDAIIARDDRARTLALAVALAWKYKRMADILTARSAEIDGNLAACRFADNAALISELLLKG